ncbi:RodZ domain-containing protein [Carnimonas nigrificans]|uniref:RodZ domain-containing protein n=1 Tax=Carnimonas nigrificans TaxID=64323 RepID=UPI00046FD089|nr:RodZ domain-containing protein [Carnimonas nigrificans]
MSEQPPTAESQPTSPTAGEMLRSARERKGWGLERAAAQLNLRPSLVNGLETEEYDQLRIPAYRRGYLRAYARLLEISPEAVLKAHDATHGTGEEPMRPSSPIKPIKRPSKLGKFAFRLISLIVLVVLIAVTVLWWRSHSGSDFSAQQDNSTSSSQLALDNEQPSSDAGNNAEESPSSSNAASDDSASQNADAASDDSQNDTSTDNTTAQQDTSGNSLQMDVGQGVDGAKMTASEAEAMGRRAQEQQSSDTATNASTESASNSAAASEGEQASAASGSNSIALTFQQESWTRITDASGQRVLDGLQRAGSQQTINGTPPFRLVIGNSSHVSVNYNGQAVDLGNHSRGGQVARLTLGNP